ncbi:MAG TPA: hypothetical protein PKE38_15840 [Ignavibacteriaceae bacterium]|nr:hypothetical protein [Ignavibacteriaceae bacterium]
METTILAKTYNIAGYEFTIKKSLTLNELNRVLEIIIKFLPSADGESINGEFTNIEMVTLLETVLEPKTKLPENFSFGDANELVANEIVTDFMTMRIDKMKAAIQSEKENKENPTN